ncbi:DUF6085 family protein [Streptomyces iconiensis]|uniref:DUF6085 family protein n=1 Tax=Streptomyces iconiensis TaxID=1384038 RepID=A0ABT7A986_9ACTN|nr:DUF6085 family protein [Streptomyces iconiensis]MDJ1137917.1 DUF6085 family protein [Streptomyces iconiensis]
MSTSVAGHCPMGCGETLMLGEGGCVTCRKLNCPQPDAVTTLLDDSETEHLVEFRETGFTIRHPLRERLGDALMECELHEWCASFNRPPVAPGRYRVSRLPNAWDIERLSPE